MSKGAVIEHSNLEKWVGSVILFEVGEHEGHGELWRLKNGFCYLFNKDKKIIIEVPIVGTKYYEPNQ